MEEAVVLRRRVLVDHHSIRRVARETGISRNTVRRYVRGAPPGVGKPRDLRGAPIRDRVAGRALELFQEAPRWTAGEQRLTAACLHQLLLQEGLVVGYSVVKQLVREWKRERQEVFVPLVYRPGDLAEVDFFEVLVDIAGERRKAHMFLLG